MEEDMEVADKKSGAEKTANWPRERKGHAETSKIGGCELRMGQEDKKRVWTRVVEERGNERPGRQGLRDRAWGRSGRKAAAMKWRNRS